MQNYQRHAFGIMTPNGYKNVCRVHFGHTQLPAPAAASATAIHAAITGSSSAAQTVTTSITDPDVPRTLVVTPGGTAADIGDGHIVITGTNVEGKTITEHFQLVDGDTTALAGKKAFKTVTSILIPVCDGAAATFSIGTGDIFGLYHRLSPGASRTLKLYIWTTEGTYTLDSSTTITDNAVDIELNTVDPTTAADGSNMYEACYLNDFWPSPGSQMDTAAGSDSYWSTSTSTSTTTSTTSSSSSSSSTSTTSSSSSSTSTSTTSSSSSTA